MPRDILDHEGNAIGSMDLPEGTPEEVWEAKLTEYSRAPQNPTITQVVKGSISKAIEFGEGLLIDYAAENVLLGITQAGKTGEVTTYLHFVSHCISTGSLYQAIIEIDLKIAESSELKDSLSPFVTNERLTIYRDKIKAYLNIPVN